MKKLLFISLLNMICYFDAQQMAVNDRLLAQLTKNQTVRVTSEKSFISSYDKQKELYDKAKIKIAQVIAIQEYIYHHLKNVNSVFRQGKKVKQIWEEFQDVIEDSKKILHYNSKYPQYSPFLYRAYEEIWIRLIKIKDYIEKEALNENNDFLLDSYDREKILIRVSDELRTLRAGTFGIIMYFERAKKIPYLLHIDKIRVYINIDKLIIFDIMKKAKYYFKNY